MENQSQSPTDDLHGDISLEEYQRLYHSPASAEDDANDAEDNANDAFEANPAPSDASLVSTTAASPESSSDSANSAANATSSLEDLKIINTNTDIGSSAGVGLTEDSINASASLSEEVSALKAQLKQAEQSKQKAEQKCDSLQQQLDTLRHQVEQLQSYKHLYEDAQKNILQRQEFVEQAQNRWWQFQNLELAYRSLDNANQLLSSQNTALRTINQKLENDYQRILAQYENNSIERNERLKAIKEPYFTNYTLQSCRKCPLGSSVNVVQVKEQRLKELNIPEPNQQWTEIAWLDFIHGKMEEYEFYFPKRLLYAFHTSLKVAEWSPLTVLAGVSGTGKSELPRLYSLFGGFNFLNLPVQPSWDSQEALLGFFNPIDNKFDAQPLLRVLEQSQMPRSQEHEDGLKETCSLVLLDELNLAHVELYFAEFLSKFEQRRGLEDEHVPELEIKLGSGVAPERLPLGRNVLWVGTMNEDETTKSLSDKVIDRGQIIHFPRPKKLQSRTHIMPLPSQPLFNMPYTFWKEKFVDSPIAQVGNGGNGGAGNGGTGSLAAADQASSPQLDPNLNPNLDLATWFQKKLSPYKETIQQINQQLGQVGRALGHRVWQSIESYMSTYPTVRQILQELNEKSIDQDLTLRLEKELSKAFEDQLVHKVMPKLRGIETRGASKSNCLDPILKLLEDQNYAIVNDFIKAMNLGYGQFIWCSADYLNEER